MARMDYFIDIDKFTKNMEGWQRGMQHLADRALTDAMEELGDKLYERLIKNLSKHKLERLMGDAYVTKYPDGFEVGVRNDSAVYIEFGTGIVGAGQPHPQPSREAWIYDINGHGIAGWWYPTTESDRNPTKYFSKNYGGWLAWTQGVKSRPFLYETWLYGTRAITPIVNKHMRRAFK